MSIPGYSIDLQAFSLGKFKDYLKTTRLLPSQQTLLENIDEQFMRLEENGIENLEQLQKKLKNKAAVQSFAEASGIPLNYLTLLRREVNSNQPQPISLIDFPGVHPYVIQKLSKIGIKNTEQLFPYIQTPQDRYKLANENQITDEEMMDLTRLTDVARTKWVGPKFARLLVESGYDSVAKISEANVEELYRALIQTNEEMNIYKGKFGKEDMKAWISIVRDVPRTIQY